MPKRNPNRGWDDSLRYLGLGAFGLGAFGIGDSAFGIRGPGRVLMLVGVSRVRIKAPFGALVLRSKGGRRDRDR